MIEFFPRGDSTSYDGFCAVKLRVPDNTKLRWTISIGEINGGPRCDHYERHLWWCRSGVVPRREEVPGPTKGRDDSKKW